MYFICNLNNDELKESFAMNRSIEEINRIVDIVMTDNDVMDELNTRILAKNLEQLKQAKAHHDGIIQVAKKMLEKEMSDEEIIELTGITVEELTELKG